MPSRCSPINDLLISEKARSNFAFLAAYRQPELQPEMCPTSGYYQVLGSPQQPLSRQRSRVRVSSSPPFPFKHLQKRLHPGVGTKRDQKGIVSTRPRTALSLLSIATRGRGLLS